MTAGFSYMNALTVIQASQGLATYLIAKCPEIAEIGVVIGHDARHNSARFARLASNAFTAKRIRVWWYASPSPTPLVAFGVNLFGAGAGIMITASHVSTSR
jgi:phosphoglucomutase